MLHANFMALRFIEPELLPIEVFHYRNRDFRPFCSCDLDLDLMTFIYEPNSYTLEMYRMCENELPTSRLSKVIVLQTYRQTYTTEIIYHAASWVVNSCLYKKQRISNKND